MKVKLIDYTGIGNKNKRFGAELLVFTKNTRLQMSPDLLDDISKWSDEKILKELEYMSNTIPSSWEMINYTFMINKCTRAFTHQLVRTRQGSYAQQTMRVLDVSGFGYEVGPTIQADENLLEDYCDIMATLNIQYQDLIQNEAAIEDARGILPTNIHTNIVAKFNLRTLAELISKRSSPRVQGEYRDFIEQIRNCVLEVHPWAEVFLRNRKHDAAEKLDNFIMEVESIGEINQESKIYLMKMVDILRQ